MTQIVVKGLSALNRRIGAYAGRLAAPLAMWEMISRELAAAETAWFEAQGEGSWKPLSAAYALRKAQEHPGAPLLVASGELRDWMVNPTKAKRIPAPDVLQWINGYGTKDAKWNIAELHRDGTPRMPARDPIIPRSRLQALALAAARVHAAWA